MASLSRASLLRDVSSAGGAGGGVGGSLATSGSSAALLASEAAAAAAAGGAGARLAGFGGADMIVTEQGVLRPAAARHALHGPIPNTLEEYEAAVSAAESDALLRTAQNAAAVSAAASAGDDAPTEHFVDMVKLASAFPGAGKPPKPRPPTRPPATAGGESARRPPGPGAAQSRRPVTTSSSVFVSSSPASSTVAPAPGISASVALDGAASIGSDAPAYGDGECDDVDEAARPRQPTLPSARDPSSALVPASATGTMVVSIASAFPVEVTPQVVAAATTAMGLLAEDAARRQEVWDQWEGRVAHAARGKSLAVSEPTHAVSDAAADTAGARSGKGGNDSASAATAASAALPRPVVDSALVKHLTGVLRASDPSLTAPTSVAAAQRDGLDGSPPPFARQGSVGRSSPSRGARGVGKGDAAYSSSFISPSEDGMGSSSKEESLFERAAATFPLKQQPIFADAIAGTVTSTNSNNGSVGMARGVAAAGAGEASQESEKQRAARALQQLGMDPFQAYHAEGLHKHESEGAGDGNEELPPWTRTGIDGDVNEEIDGDGEADGKGAEGAAADDGPAGGAEDPDDPSLSASSELRLGGKLRLFRSPLEPLTLKARSDDGGSAGSPAVGSTAAAAKRAGKKATVESEDDEDVPKMQPGDTRFFPSFGEFALSRSFLLSEIAC